MFRAASPGESATQYCGNECGRQAREGRLSSCCSPKILYEYRERLRRLGEVGTFWLFSLAGNGGTAAWGCSAVSALYLDCSDLVDHRAAAAGAVDPAAFVRIPLARPPQHVLALLPPPRGLHSFPFQLNLSSSVHRITQLN
jgi:hypothetical protein